MQHRDSGEHGEGGASANANSVAYKLHKMQHTFEDILFCVDVDRQMEAEMKSVGAKGQTFTRMDCIKQAISLFVHSKLTINPNHRFAFAKLDHSATWILIYCRSSVVPECPSHWPENQKLFTLDVMYLHDKPSGENCPQKVYDALVDALERVSEHEGYIFENGTGITRVLFRDTCILLSHPQQRCAQDDNDIPKVLKKSVTPADATASGTSSRKEGSSTISQ
ncbi:uncharacterized protein LOC131051191 isoform X2 [Cryptomeria japonica]|uniref:uncharacterized protein LOC131051191 isoform X2 n=1 Tax=Cryptomeria japonica TaxID=3369 RepID=UPI0027D9DE47|nr:uncharacterized protein LOC131051191 isoform X2 [Cryptomeria japonica]